jgi:hypothetical protein
MPIASIAHFATFTRVSTPRSALLRALRLVLLVAPLALLAGLAIGDDELFEMLSFTSGGRSVAAELADLNGDGRVDFFVVTLDGMPPEEKRLIRVYLQKSDGGFPQQPNHSIEVPGWSAVYDVGDVRADSPGEELVLLQPDAVELLSLADASGKSWKLPLPGPTSAGMADDERGFEPFKLIYREFGEEPWILVPQFGEMTALSPTGEVRARLAVPRRANYFIIPTTGMVTIESDFQLFIDIPKLGIGDVDGDGRADVVSSTRHELRVFLRREDGGFDFEPSRLIPLRKVTPRDHIRSSGGVTCEARDVDGDGRLDLLMSHVQGGLADAKTTITLHMNHDGGWNLDRPDQTLSHSSSLGSAALIDLDGDGTRDLVRVEFSFSVWEVVEILLSKEIDLQVKIHRLRTGTQYFPEKPDIEKKISIPFSFETFRPRGFVPTAHADLNGDGYRDFISSGSGKAIEIELGGPKGLFSRKGGRQETMTAGVIHFRDYDGDRLLDFILFDPHHFDVPVRLGRNLGQLPGTAPSLSPQQKP